MLFYAKNKYNFKNITINMSLRPMYNRNISKKLLIHIPYNVYISFFNPQNIESSHPTHRYFYVIHMVMLNMIFCKMFIPGMKTQYLSVN